jgi:hypothetical protein
MKQQITLEAFLEECKRRNLTAPAALKPDDRDYPVVVSAEFPEGRTNPPFFADFELGVVWAPDQAPRKFVVRSNIGGSGAIALATVEGKIVLIRQWRTALGRYTWEIPRGFSEKWESGCRTSKDTLPKGLQTALREANEEIGGNCVTVIPHFLGEIAENSGTSVGSPAYWWLELNGFRADETTPSLKLVSLDEAIQEVEDNHSCAGLILLQRYQLKQKQR